MQFELNKMRPHERDKEIKMECKAIDKKVMLKLGKMTKEYDLSKSIESCDQIEQNLSDLVDALSSKTLLKSVLTHGNSHFADRHFSVEQSNDVILEDAAAKRISWEIHRGGEPVSQLVLAKAITCLYERSFDGVVDEPVMTKNAILGYHKAFRASLSQFDKGGRLYSSVHWLKTQRETKNYVEVALEIWNAMFDSSTRVSIAQGLGLDLCDVSVRHIVLLLGTVLGEKPFDELAYRVAEFCNKDIQLRV